VSSNVLKGDEKLLKAREDQGKVARYLASFDFDSALKQDIKTYFQSTSATSSISSSDIFDSVSQSLRLEISNDMTRNCLDNSDFFRGCSAQLKDSIKVSR